MTGLENQILVFFLSGHLKQVLLYGIYFYFQIDFIVETHPAFEQTKQAAQKE